MYVVSFYSYKGGVGRSMALVNVAYELVNAGHRVLLVDFDLEAPGLHTFDFLRPPESTPGLVEFVTEYLATGVAPDVQNFAYQVPTNGKGALYVMPSGRMGSGYAQLLAGLSWQHLYSERNGYLLFEDLKQQWNDVFSCNYVLIDSRTGHTDIGGICTRQLPDAVALFFFPNDQNLRGLAPIVKDIRAEALSPRRKAIDLHFVMSNVPDLDDEDLILEARIDAFKQELGFESLTQTIYRYDSLALLNQAVFTLDRPRSRLAREYRALCNAIVRNNLGDRQAAISVLRELVSSVPAPQSAAPSQLSDDIVSRILDCHSTDGEILYLVGRHYVQSGQFEEALVNLSASAAAGFDRPEVFLARGQLRQFRDERLGAEQDALYALKFERLSVRQALSALSLLKDTESEFLASAVSLLAGREWKFGDRIKLASLFSRKREQMPFAVEFLNQPDSYATDFMEVRIELCCALIGSGRFHEAVRIALRGGQSPETLNIYDSFNYAMAIWGAEGTPPKNVLTRVVEFGSERSEGDRDANHDQCIAIAAACLGEHALCMNLLRSARDRVGTGGAFSGWRYLRVSQADFVRDLNSVEEFLNGSGTKPAFIQVATNSTASSKTT